MIAILELSVGNQVTGVSWLETKTFAPTTKLVEVTEWAEGCTGTKGKLILTVEKE